MEKILLRDRNGTQPSRRELEVSSRRTHLSGFVFCLQLEYLFTSKSIFNLLRGFLLKFEWEVELNRRLVWTTPIDELKSKDKFEYELR